MFRSIKTKLNVAADLNISDLSAFKSVYLTIEFNFLSPLRRKRGGPIPELTTVLQPNLLKS